MVFRTETNQVIGLLRQAIPGESQYEYSQNRYARSFFFLGHQQVNQELESLGASQYAEQINQEFLFLGHPSMIIRKRYPRHIFFGIILDHLVLWIFRTGNPEN